MTDTFWTFEQDGEIYDADFDTKEKAQQRADELWADNPCNDDMCNGEISEADIYLINYSYDDDGERAIISREFSTVYHEYYHGDFAEHNTHWGLL